MTEAEKATWYIQHPVELAHVLGWRDLRDDPHGKWINSMLTSGHDSTTQAHRGAYKTTCLVIVISLLMLKERDKNIIFFRKTDNDVTEVIRAVKNVLTSPVMQDIYKALTGRPLVILRDNSAEITLQCFDTPRGAAQLLGIGINGSLTGKHADIIITDDIVNLKDRVSRAEREHTKAVYQELQNIRNPGGRIINTGTPWHKEDAFTLMPEPEKWDYKATGLLSDEQIEALKQSMSPSLFAANYELRHIASEGALFTTIPKTVKEVNENGRHLLADGIAHIDAAYGGEDYTALTLARRAGDKIYLYGKLWSKHVDTVLSHAVSLCSQYRCAPIHVEINGDKGYLSREIRNRGYAAFGYTESQNKYIKISSYLRKWWPNVIFIEGTDREYIDQILDYTDTAAHDDAPDSAACVCRILDR